MLYPNLLERVVKVAYGDIGTIETAEELADVPPAIIEAAVNYVLACARHACVQGESSPGLFEVHRRLLRKFHLLHTLLARARSER